MTKTATVIGGGPAGLMAAEVLARAGARVTLCEAMPTPGRKFLRAGVGGLNLSRDEDCETFLARYGAARDFVAPHLAAFGPAEVRAWADGLGAETFVGSSGKIFPKAMKTAPLLRAWLARLNALGVSIRVRHRWRGWTADGSLRFDTPEGEVALHPDVTVLALGGASWPRLGSDGGWCAFLAERGVEFSPWRPANCGFEVDWSEVFRDRFAGAPLSNAVFSFGGARLRGTATIAGYGIEGGAVYTLSAALRDAIAAEGRAVLRIDLAPDRDAADIVHALARPRGARSFSTHLRRTCGLDGVRAALARESAPGIADLSPIAQAAAIKDVRVICLRPRPLAEAISSAGGIGLAELDDDSLMLKRLPGLFCAGEMLDWEAPTGGYLMTACLSLGRSAGIGAAGFLGLVAGGGMDDSPPIR
jgi:uncharacterized flavoprotein (TIGR03862 family)